MENENDQIVESEETQEESQEESQNETDEISEEETIDWKAKALEAEGKAKRYKNRLEKLKSNPEKTETKTKKTGEDLDYGHLAYFNLNSKDIKIGDADIDFLKSTMEETGKSQKELLGKKWFRDELKEHQEARTVKEAIPSTTKRSGSTQSNKVEYWMQKPFSQVPQEFRREVLAAKLKKDSDNSKFSDNAVITQNPL